MQTVWISNINAELVNLERRQRVNGVAESAVLRSVVCFCTQWVRVDGNFVKYFIYKKYAVKRG